MLLKDDNAFYYFRIKDRFMFKENPQAELVTYIAELESSEQTNLLKQLKLRKALLQARALDKKQRAFNKGKQLLSNDEIVSIVRNIRKTNAKSPA